MIASLSRTTSGSPPPTAWCSQSARALEPWSCLSAPWQSAVGERVLTTPEARSVWYCRVSPQNNDVCVALSVATVTHGGSNRPFGDPHLGLVSIQRLHEDAIRVYLQGPPGKNSDDYEVDW